MVSSARFFLDLTSSITLADRTETVMDWDNIPLVNTPTGFFSFNSSTNVITFNVTGLYYLNLSARFGNPSNPGEFMGVALQTGAGIHIDWFFGMVTTDSTVTRHHGVMVRRFTKDDTVRTNWYQAQTLGTSLANNGIDHTNSDIVFLDKV